MTSHVNVLQELPPELLVRARPPLDDDRAYVESVLAEVRARAPRPCAGGCGRLTPALWARCVRCEVEARRRARRTPLQRAVRAVAIAAAYITVGAAVAAVAFLATVYWLAGATL